MVLMQSTMRANTNRNIFIYNTHVVPLSVIEHSFVLQGVKKTRSPRGYRRFTVLL